MDSLAGVCRGQSEVVGVQRLFDRLGDIGMVRAYTDYLRSDSGGMPATFAEFVGIVARSGGAERFGFSAGECDGRWLGCLSGGDEGARAGVASVAADRSGVNDVGVSGDANVVVGETVRAGEGLLRDSGVVDGAESVVGSGLGRNTLRNREWRKKKKLRKERRRSEVAEAEVPEWRRKRPGALVHKGFFSECSTEVRASLVDSRARMLVAKNEAAVVAAEVDARRQKALLKSQEVERSVELKRLRTEAGLKVEVERKFGVNYATGFARTVVSEGLEDVISVPSLSSGTVSPDSSISVEQVQKMESVIAKQAQELSELRSRVEALTLAKVEGSVGAVPVTNSRFPIGFEEEKLAWDAIDYDPSYHEGMTGLDDDEIRESEAIYDRTKANGFMSEVDKRRNDAINAKVFRFREQEKRDRILAGN